MPVLCPSCGTVGRDADRTCAACGTDLADDPVALIPPELAAPPPRVTASRRPSIHARRTRVALIAAAAVAVAAGAVTAVVLWRGSASPSTSWTTVPVRVPTLEQPTAVRVAGSGPAGQLRVADLATGRVRELRRHGTAVSATAVLTRGDALVVGERDGRVEAFRALDRDAPHVTPLGRADTVVPASDPDRIWVERGSRVTEVGVDGRVSLRATLPAGYRVAGGGLDADALLLTGTVRARSIVWNPRTHATVLSTQSGTAYTAAAHTVVTGACDPPIDTCHMVATDPQTRGTQALDTPVWDAFEPPVIVARAAPDGSSVAFGEAFPGHHGIRATMTLVDTRSGRVMWSSQLTRSSSAPTAWDERSDLLFFTDGVTAFVHHVDGPPGNRFSLGSVRELQPLAVLPRAVRTPAGGARG
ncbi:MAG TPA: zinc ribbon domain-containing protein [Acidimicrobiia bacterium]|jgi:hypothetical protein